MAFPKRGRGRRISRQRLRSGSKAVVALKGTLDQPGDRDLGWTVEGRIPWSAFATGGGKPSRATSGSSPYAAMIMARKGTKPVLMSSAPLTKPSFHRYEDYGKLRFEGPRERPR